MDLLLAQFFTSLALLTVFNIRHINGDCDVIDHGFPLTYPEGLEWKDGCDACMCVNSQVVCEGGPTCDIPHSDALAWSCIRWSEDKCCCLRQGCVGFDDNEYDFGQLMPMDASGCEQCECSEHSLTAKCFVAETVECSKINHDHPFVSTDLHHHQPGK